MRPKPVLRSQSQSAELKSAIAEAAQLQCPRSGRRLNTACSSCQYNIDRPRTVCYLLTLSADYTPNPRLSLLNCEMYRIKCLSATVNIVTGLGWENHCWPKATRFFAKFVYVTSILHCICAQIGGLQHYICHVFVSAVRAVWKCCTKFVNDYKPAGLIASK